MDLTLTVVDTTGIQNFIFGTNNLQQNVGASELVKSVTGKWLVEALPPAHNVANVVDVTTHSAPLAYDDAQRIEQAGLEAEVIYAGGGNALLLFASRAVAIAFTRALTSRVLREAPGLQVVVSHDEFNWRKESLGGRDGKLESALKEMVRRKTAHVGDNRQLGLAVTAAGVFTDKPAVGRDNDQRLLSAEAKAKQRIGQAIQEPIDLRGKFESPRAFDDFGQLKGTSSYIAVVHADGNSMGKRFQALRDGFADPSQNRDYVRALRKLSTSIFNASHQALQNTVDALANALKREGSGYRIGRQEFPLTDNKIPFRTLVLGGDDVTFVCEGRLGLTLATRYLEEIAKIPLDDGNGEPMYARAGVAIVKSHYPFAQAYALADALAGTARARLKESTEEKMGIDWHFVQSGITGTLKEIRAREYVVPAGKLIRRPLFVGATRPESVHAWENFASVVEGFHGEEWAERRNKLIALRDVLRDGPEAVKTFREANRLPKLPPVPDLPDMKERGWQGETCGYFDAIEALDFYVPLPTEERS